MYNVSVSSLLKDNYQYLLKILSDVAQRHNERVLVTKNNPISIGNRKNN